MTRDPRPAAAAPSPPLFTDAELHRIRRACWDGKGADAGLTEKLLDMIAAERAARTEAVESDTPAVPERPAVRTVRARIGETTVRPVYPVEPDEADKAVAAVVAAARKMVDADGGLDGGCLRACIELRAALAAWDREGE